VTVSPTCVEVEDVDFTTDTADTGFDVQSAEPLAHDDGGLVPVGTT
jgi:hypothetical protein